MPGIGQALNVAEDLVTHGFDQGLRTLGIVHPEDILGRNLHQSHRHNGKSHHPQVLPQVGKASQAVHKIHDKAGKVPLLSPNGAVHRRPDDLRIHHIRKSGDPRRQQTDGKVPLRAPKEPPQQRPLLPRFFLHFLCFHIPLQLRC